MRVWCRHSPTGFLPEIGCIGVSPILKIWRQGAEGRAIALSSPLPFLSCGVFAYLAARLGLHSVASTLKLAVAVWLIGPLPLILTNAAFMKLHRVFVASFATGWLVKLAIVAVAVGWLLY